MCVSFFTSESVCVLLYISNTVCPNVYQQMDVLLLWASVCVLLYINSRVWFSIKIVCPNVNHQILLLFVLATVFFILYKFLCVRLYTGNVCVVLYTHISEWPYVKCNSVCPSVFHQIWESFCILTTVCVPLYISICVCLSVFQQMCESLYISGNVCGLLYITKCVCPPAHQDQWVSPCI